MLARDFPNQVKGMSLEDFAVDRATEGLAGLNDTRTKAIIEGLLFSSYRELASGGDERAAALAGLALKVYETFQSKFESQLTRVGLPPFLQLKQAAVQRALQELHPQLATQLRSALGLPAPAVK